jgi:hypothetical protein
MNPLILMLSNTNIYEDYEDGSEFYIENYLLNNLGFEYKNFANLGHGTNTGNIVDTKTEYRINNFGFRDEDWTDKASILTAGCSNTYGVGVPVKGTWPEILKDITNKKTHNLSGPGISIQQLVFQIFAYFKTFGNPETLICFFPDPFRMQVPVKKNLVKVGDGPIKSGIRDISLDYKTKNKISNSKKYLKIPYDYNEILPMEFPLFFSMKLIHILEQYCNSNNIKIIWSSWDKNLRDVLNKVDTTFNNFYNHNDFIMGPVLDHENKPRNCHLEYKNKFLKYFESGQDIENGAEYAHPGVHRHIHVAEAFYKKLSQ